MNPEGSQRNVMSKCINIVVFAILICLPALCWGQIGLSAGAGGQYYVYGEKEFYGLTNAGGVVAVKVDLGADIFLQGDFSYNVSEDTDSRGVVNSYDWSGGLGYQWEKIAAGVDLGNSQFPDGEFVGGWSGGVFAQLVLPVNEIELIIGGRVSPFGLFEVRNESLYFLVMYRIR